MAVEYVNASADVRQLSIIYLHDGNNSDLYLSWLSFKADCAQVIIIATSYPTTLVSLIAGCRIVVVDVIDRMAVEAGVALAIATEVLILPTAVFGTSRSVFVDLAGCCRPASLDEIGLVSIYLDRRQNNQSTTIADCFGVDRDLICAALQAIGFDLSIYWRLRHEERRRPVAPLVPKSCRCVAPGICRDFNLPTPIDRSMLAVCRSAASADRLAILTKHARHCQGGRFSSVPNCAYFGDRLGSVRTGVGDGTIPLHQCLNRRRLTTTVRDCVGCGDWSPPAPSSIGVVIGSYLMPSAVELQVRMLRHLCGPLPILIADDCGGAPHETAVRAIADAYDDVTFWGSMRRHGHFMGDVLAMWRGLCWARSRDLKVVIKLSQRLFIDLPFWAQQISGDLLVAQHGLAVAPDADYRCRTEAVAFQCANWTEAAVARLADYRGGLVEHFIADLSVELFGAMPLWFRVLTANRDTEIPGIYWRAFGSDIDYEQLANAYGLGLGSDWHLDDWSDRDRID